MIVKWNPSFLETDYSKRVTFPIHESCISAKGKKQIGYSELTNFPQATRNIIMGNQPCCRGDMAALHPLAVIQRLNNADKHRVLALTTVVLTHGAVGLKIKGASPIGLFATYIDGSFKPGNELVRRAGGVELMRARGSPTLMKQRFMATFPRR